MQQLMLDTLVAAVTHSRADHGTVIAAVRETLADATLDAAFIGEAVLLPSENFIGDQLAVVEPEAIFRARATLRRDLGTPPNRPCPPLIPTIPAGLNPTTPPPKAPARRPTSPPIITPPPHER